MLCANTRVIIFGQRLWDEESIGEVSEGQQPILTEAQERHSLIPQHQPTEEQSPHATLSSPGQSQPKHTGTPRFTHQTYQNTALSNIL